MNALVISGGGCKGAFAGGVAQYLIQDLGKKYDMFLGTSTGSLMISHLALNKIDKIRTIYTSVNQESIFSNCPFSKKTTNGIEEIGINHINVLKNFLKGSKTFGESHNLRKLIKEIFTVEEFITLQSSSKEIIVTVSNLSLNQTEYKSIKDFSYDEFCDWIWISCNFTPFMSLVNKNGCDYADGGLGVIAPIEEAIRCGAKTIDAIILDTEVSNINRLPSRNPFSLLTNMFVFMLDRIAFQNIVIGKNISVAQGIKLNLYFTPTVLTTNSLVFHKEEMEKWWNDGYNFSKQKHCST